MIQDDIRTVLEALLEKSNAKQVVWSKAGDVGQPSAGVDDFVVVLPNSSINIWRDEDNTLHGRILNTVGDVIVYVNASESKKDESLLQQLLESARRSIYKVEETLAEIKEILKKSNTVGDSTISRPVTDDDIPY